jgi:hypothetical protein
LTLLQQKGKTMPVGPNDSGEEILELASGKSVHYGRQVGFTWTVTFTVNAGTVLIDGHGKRDETASPLSCANRCKIKLTPASFDSGTDPVEVDQLLTQGDTFTYEGGLVLAVTALNGPATIHRSWTTA